MGKTGMIKVGVFLVCLNGNSFIMFLMHFYHNWSYTKIVSCVNGLVPLDSPTIRKDLAF